MNESVTNKPRGGTELLLENLRNCVRADALDGINLITSNTDPSLLKAGEINVLWNHHSYDQPAVANMRHPKYVDAIDYFDKLMDQFQEAMNSEYEEILN